MSDVLREFPGELAIVAHRAGWQLLIHGPFLSGEVVSPHREKLLRLAEGYGQLRRSMGPDAAAWVQTRREAAAADEAFWAPGGLR